jgi:hypothetical protein
MRDSILPLSLFPVWENCARGFDFVGFGRKIALKGSEGRAGFTEFLAGMG